MTEQEKQWFWIADFCKKKGWPPHQSWAWNLAAEAYLRHLEKGDIDGEFIGSPVGDGSEFLNG